MQKLTEKRSADRVKMARLVELLAIEHGWKAEYSEFNTSLETRIDLTGPRGLSVGVEFESKNAMPDNYCLAWHFALASDDTAFLSDAFGRYQGSSINGTHRRKCTAFAKGIDTLLDKLDMAMQMARDNTAFASPAAFIMKNYAAYHPGDAWHYMLYDKDMGALTSRVMTPAEARDYIALHSLQCVSPMQMQKAGIASGKLNA